MADLLQYLESTSLVPAPRLTAPDRSETNFFTGDPLRALSTLSYSDNVDLQRSAALAFAEITEKVRTPSRPVLPPSVWAEQR